MGWKLSLFFLLLGVASSFAITNDEYIVANGLTGRNLLQQKSSCPINFESQNYTIITSQCKGPAYGKQCCVAFKQFACPFRDELNDPKADCASTMFSYINIYGKYPPGLFANICLEGKEGLDCNGVDAPVAKEEDNKSDASKSCLSTKVMIVSGLVMLLWNAI